MSATTTRWRNSSEPLGYLGWMTEWIATIRPSSRPERCGDQGRLWRREPTQSLSQNCLGQFRLPSRFGWFAIVRLGALFICHYTAPSIIFVKVLDGVKFNRRPASGRVSTSDHYHSRQPKRHCVNRDRSGLVLCSCLLPYQSVYQNRVSQSIS